MAPPVRSFPLVITPHTVATSGGPSTISWTLCEPVGPSRSVTVQENGVGPLGVVGWTGAGGGAVGGGTGATGGGPSDDTREGTEAALPEAFAVDATDGVVACVPFAATVSLSAEVRPRRMPPTTSPPTMNPMTPDMRDVRRVARCMSEVSQDDGYRVTPQVIDSTLI